MRPPLDHVPVHREPDEYSGSRVLFTLFCLAIGAAFSALMFLLLT